MRRSLATILAVVSICVVLIGGNALSGERAPAEGSLTDDVENWIDMPREMPFEGYAHCEIDVDYDVAYEGEFSLRIHGEAGNIPHVGYLFPEPLDLMGRDWVLRIAVKVSDDSEIPWMFFDFRNDLGPPYPGGISDLIRVSLQEAPNGAPAIPQPGEWTVYEIGEEQFDISYGTFMPFEVDLFNIGFSVEGDYTLWIDAVSIEILE